MRNLKTCLAALVLASLSLQIYAQTSDPTPYNRSKGARDPAGWLPPNVDYHCHYVKSWLWIKHVNQLEMDLEERAAIETVLGAPVETVMLTDEQASLILRWLVLFTSQCKG